MKISLSSEASRVHACLELHTMGFRQERAVRLHKGQLIPITPALIAQETGLSKQHVRRALEELEYHGLAERRPITGTALTKGNVEIYSWAVPRGSARDQNGSHARLPFPGWFSESLKPLVPIINHLRYKLPQELPGDLPDGADAYISALEEAARSYQEAEKVARGLLERVCARQRINKEESNRKDILEIPPPPPPPPPPVEGTNRRSDDDEDRSQKITQPQTRTPPPEPPHSPQPDPKPQNLYQEFKEAYPKDHFDEAKAKRIFLSLSPAKQKRAIARLREVYVLCERWRDQNGRWIPLASTFLNSDSYDADPPPKLNTRPRNGASKSDEEIIQGMRERRERRERWQRGLS
jgi:hypothetical protein